MKTVAFFPSLISLSENPYWTILANGLESKGWNVIKDNPDSFRIRWLWANRNNILVLHIHFVQQFYHYEKYYAKLRWVLRFLRNILIARILGYRLVFTLHNLTPTYRLSPYWVDYLGHWVAIRFSNKIIVHCEYSRKRLIQIYHRKKNVFIVHHPNFINHYPNQISKAEAKRKMGYKTDEIIFGFFGGIRPNKGIDLLINAFYNLKGENLRLLIVGKPWPPDIYIKKIKYLVSQDERIKLIPNYIAEDKIQIYLNAIDIGVFPFTQILTSSSVTLAMSFRCPVIVPNLGCLSEIISNETGWFFDFQNSKTLQLLMNKARLDNYQMMGIKAYNKISKYTVDQFVSNTIEIYQDGF